VTPDAVLATLASVDGPVLLCTDGSDVSLEALAAGLELLSDRTSVAIVSVAEEPDPMSLSGTGLTGADMTADEFAQELDAARQGAQAIVAAAQTFLGLEGSDSYVVGGGPGAAICQLASELSATAIVVGSRGHGRLKRAFLGSVSDHVVRNAPCPVLVTRHQVGEH
jgi:nucleotide-binding universal stress UspA family protein